MTPDEVRRTMLRPDSGALDPPARAIYRGPRVLILDDAYLESGDEVEVFGEHSNVVEFWVRRRVNDRHGTTSVRARSLEPVPDKPPSSPGYRLLRHPTGQTELQVTDWQGTELWVGGPGSTGATAQVRVGPRGPDRAVHLDRDAAIAVRDQLTRLIEGAAR